MDTCLRCECDWFYDTMFYPPKKTRHSESEIQLTAKYRTFVCHHARQKWVGYSLSEFRCLFRTPPSLSISTRIDWRNNMHNHRFYQVCFYESLFLCITFGIANNILIVLQRQRMETIEVLIEILTAIIPNIHFQSFEWHIVIN